MADLIIKGTPLVRFWFDHLPSWNDAIQAARGRGGHWTGQSHTKIWRQVGNDIATQFMGNVVHFTPNLIEKRAMVIVKVGRATERTYDVHNTYAKAVFDGFSEAGIWKDDSWMFVPWVLYGWVHMSDLDPQDPDHVGNLFLIEVYELERVFFNDTEYILPNWGTGT